MHPPIRLADPGLCHQPHIHRSKISFSGVLIRSVLSCIKALYFQHVLFLSGSAVRIKSSITGDPGVYRRRRAEGLSGETQSGGEGNEYIRI